MAADVECGGFVDDLQRNQLPYPTLQVMPFVREGKPDPVAIRSGVSRSNPVPEREDRANEREE